MGTSENRKAADRKYYEGHREECIARTSEYCKLHPERVKAINARYKKNHPEILKAANWEISRKDGKFYEKNLKYKRTGVQGEKNTVRANHSYMWRPYKNIIAPLSQIHHEWIPGTADYRGVALVEADQHMHGVIKVIEVLEGNITMLTEVEVNGGVE